MCDECSRPRLGEVGQGISSLGNPVHSIDAVLRCMVVRVGYADQVSVLVVGERGLVAQGIRRRCNLIESVVDKTSLLVEWIGD